MLRPFQLLIAVLLVTAGTAPAATRILELPAIDPARLVAADKALADDGPLRVADPWDGSLAPDDGDGWALLPDGSHRWRLEVRAPGALSLAFGFGRYALPWGGTLDVVGERGPERHFSWADGHQGQLWTPVVLGERAVITLTLPPGYRDSAILELNRVGRGYRFFGEPAAGKQGPCNIDVVCPEGDDWREEIRSVGVYQFGASLVCTGAMINNTAEDGRPYFLTAYHCGVNASNAASVVVYWNYESPECGDLAGGGLEDSQTGATWRASYGGSDTTSDMTLIELAAAPDTSYHVTYAGWNRTDAIPSSAVAIHHPSTDEKAISFEDDPLEKTAYLDETTDPGGNHWRVVDWDLGTTERGSSGSPLFDPSHRIVGQLHGGYAACGNDESDWYGRFDVSWSGGGTDDSRLSSWLDAAGTGAVTLDTFDPLNPDDPDDPEDPDPVESLTLLTLGNPVRAGEPAVFELTPAVSGHVTVKVVDLAGRLVATLLEGPLTANESAEVAWAGTGAAAGVYFLHVEGPEGETSRAFTRLR